MRILLAAAALTGLFASAALTSAVWAQGDADAFRYLTKEQAMASIAKRPASGPAINLLSNHDDFSEALVQRFTSGQPEIHENYTDYMIFLEGKGTINIGGAVKNKKANPNGTKGEWLADSSTGGKVYDLVPGAMIIIPKGMPHWMQLPAGGQLRYLAFKRKG
jgi:mannose-6-phosphate isomerase-like protein (cupin superfamily)